MNNQCAYEFSVVVPPSTTCSTAYQFLGFGPNLDGQTYDTTRSETLDARSPKSFVAGSIII